LDERSWNQRGWWSWASVRKCGGTRVGSISRFTCLPYYLSLLSLDGNIPIASHLGEEAVCKWMYVKTTAMQPLRTFWEESLVRPQQIARHTREPKADACSIQGKRGGEATRRFRSAQWLSVSAENQKRWERRCLPVRTTSAVQKTTSPICTDKNGCSGSRMPAQAWIDDLGT